MSVFDIPNSELESVRQWVKKAYFSYKLGEIDKYNHILNKILPGKLEFLSQSEAYRGQKLEDVIQKEYQSLETSWLIGECVVALLEKNKRQTPWYARVPLLNWLCKKTIRKTENDILQVNSI